MNDCIEFTTLVYTSTIYILLMGSIKAYDLHERSPPHSLHHEASLGDRTGLHQGLFASRAKVWSTTQSAKDVTNVVGRLDALGESGIPSVQNTLHNLDTGRVDILNSGLETSLIRIEKVVHGILARVRTVKVGRGAHDDNTREVCQVARGGAQEGLQRRVVLLRGRAVQTCSVGQDASCVLEGIAQDVSAVVNIGGSDVALDHGGTSSAGLVDIGSSGVVGAVGLCSGGIRQVGGLCELNCQRSQGGVHFEDLGSVDVGRILVRRVGSLGDVSGAIVGRDLAGIELVLQSDLDRETSEGHGTERRDLRVDPGDPGDEEVCLGQIEKRGGDQRRDRDGSIDLRFTGDQLADAVVGSAMRVGEDGREAGHGDVVRKEVEFWDSPPGFSFRGELDHDC